MSRGADEVLGGTELLEAFRKTTIRPGGFSHAQHIEVAWHYLKDAPLLEAMGRFERDLARLVTALGAESKYHRTITIAYVLIVHERRAEAPDDETYEKFCIRNDDLFEDSRAPLLRYYTEAALSDPRARRELVLPDRGIAADREASMPGESA